MPPFRVFRWVSERASHIVPCETINHLDLFKSKIITGRGYFQDRFTDKNKAIVVQHDRKLGCMFSDQIGNDIPTFLCNRLSE